MHRFLASRLSRQRFLVDDRPLLRRESFNLSTFSFLYFFEYALCLSRQSWHLLRPCTAGPCLRLVVQIFLIRLSRLRVFAFSVSRAKHMRQSPRWTAIPCRELFVHTPPCLLLWYFDLDGIDQPAVRVAMMSGGVLMTDGSSANREVARNASCALCAS